MLATIERNAERLKQLEAVYKAAAALGLPVVGREYDVRLRCIMREGPHKGKAIETPIGHIRDLTDALGIIGGPEGVPAPC